MTRHKQTPATPARLSTAVLAALVAGALVAHVGSVSSAARGIPRCTVGQLEVQAGRTGIAAGSELSEFAFINHGPGRCSLYGYPRLVMLDASGRPIPTTDRDAQPGFDNVPQKAVTLARRQRAWFGVFYADRTGYGTLKCPTAAKLKLTPPQLDGTVTLAGRGAHIAPYGGSIPHLHCGIVHVTPVDARRLQ